MYKKHLASLVSSEDALIQDTLIQETLPQNAYINCRNVLLSFPESYFLKLRDGTILLTDSQTSFDAIKNAKLYMINGIEIGIFYPDENMPFISTIYKIPQLFYTRRYECTVSLESFANTTRIVISDIKQYFFRELIINRISYEINNTSIPLMKPDDIKTGKKIMEDIMTYKYYRSLTTNPHAYDAYDYINGSDNIIKLQLLFMLGYYNPITTTLIFMPYDGCANINNMFHAVSEVYRKYAELRNHQLKISLDPKLSEIINTYIFEYDAIILYNSVKNENWTNMCTILDFTYKNLIKINIIKLISIIIESPTALGSVPVNIILFLLRNDNKDHIGGMRKKHILLLCKKFRRFDIINFINTRCLRPSPLGKVLAS